MDPEVALALVQEQIKTNRLLEQLISLQRQTVHELAVFNQREARRPKPWLHGVDPAELDGVERQGG